MAKIWKNLFEICIKWKKIYEMFYKINEKLQ